MTADVVGNRYALVDGEHRSLGWMHIDQVRDGVVLGTFRRAPDFERVRELFREHEELVNAQVFPAVDRAAARIAELGLYLEDPLTGGQRALHDVQIMNEQDIAFR